MTWGWQFEIPGRELDPGIWLEPDAPSIENWYSIIHEIFIKERIIFSMFQEQKIEEIWKM